MKKIILFILLLNVFLIKAQSNYHRSFTQSDNTISDIVYANEHNTSSFVISNFMGVNAYESFGMITKFTTTTGAITSSKTFSFTGNDITIIGASKKNNALYVAASLSNPNPSASGTLIYKYNLTSNTISWRKTLYFDQDYSVNSITTDNLKNLYILGSVYNATTSVNGLCITKMDTIGNVLWSKAFGSEILDEYPSTILFKNNREIYISTMNFESVFGNTTIIRLDSAGTIINTAAITTTISPRFGNSVATIFNNKLVLCDNTISGPSDQGPVLIRTIDSNLVTLNSKIISGINIRSIQAAGNQLLVSGQAPVADGKIGFRSIRFDTTLNTLAARYFNKMSTFSISSSNVSFINVANQSIHAFKPGGNDSLFIVKADANENTGCRDTAFVPAIETLSYTASTYTYALIPIITNTASISFPVSNYTVNSTSLCNGITTNMNDDLVNRNQIIISPNPTDGLFTIIGIEDVITFITITDALGREILRFNNSTNLDISSLQQGVYFISVYNKNGAINTVKKLYKN